MSTKRLLMTADAVGGVWQYATELAAAFGAHGWETVLAVLGPAPTADQRAGLDAAITVIETGLPLDWLADGPEAVRRSGAAIAALAEDVGADLVQLNSAAISGAVMSCMPVVVVDHGGIAPWWEAAYGTELPQEFSWQRALARDGLHAHTVVAPTQNYASAVMSLYQLPTAPHVVHNGRTPLGLPATAERAHHAFTAGRLWDQVKNTDVLDRAAARLAVPFRAAGPLTGPHGETVAPAHLEPLGTLSASALAQELAERPVFVSAATFEPFGLAVLEAAQAGCALVLADIPSFRELWDGAAVFVPPGDDEGFAAAISELLAEHAYRIRLERAAEQRAARYTPQAMAAGMAAIFAGMLAPANEHKAAA